MKEHSQATSAHRKGIIDKRSLRKKYTNSTEVNMNLPDSWSFKVKVHFRFRRHETLYVSVSSIDSAPRAHIYEISLRRDVNNPLRTGLV
jgi:hypothetical protein